MRRARIGALVWGGVAALACGDVVEVPAPEPDERTPLERGAALYADLECAGCHETAAFPGQEVVPLEGLSERHAVETLAAFLAAPPPPMIVYSLTEEERLDVARYVLETFP